MGLEEERVARRQPQADAMRRPERGTAGTGEAEQRWRQCAGTLARVPGLDVVARRLDLHEHAAALIASLDAILPMIAEWRTDIR
jgi:hypothetical protein